MWFVDVSLFEPLMSAAIPLDFQTLCSLERSICITFKKAERLLDLELGYFKLCWNYRGKMMLYNHTHDKCFVIHVVLKLSM